MVELSLSVYLFLFAPPFCRSCSSFLPAFELFEYFLGFNFIASIGFLALPLYFFSFYFILSYFIFWPDCSWDGIYSFNISHST